MESVVHVESLRHQYEDRVALDGIALDVRAGECFGLLGPNGGGKTTLFRILTTLLQPTSGRAAIFGRDVVREREAVRRRIGVVFQSPSLDIYLTVRENLRHSGELYGRSGRGLDESIESLLTQLGIADRAKDLVRKLSGGLRRRVEIAACMLHEPDVLILDEPSTGLDPSARHDLWNLFDSLRQTNGLTILLTTHFMEEADRCDRLALLDRGKLVASGSPTELKARIGCDCIRIECDEPERLRERVLRHLNLKTSVVGHSLRIEAVDGGGHVADLMNSFGNEIRSVTIGKPTLEDVFIHLTGHRFDGEPQ